MRRYQSTLLAGIAALALAAGTGFASAQTASPSGDHGKAGGSSTVQSTQSSPSSETMGKQGAIKNQKGRQNHEAQSGSKSKPSEHSAANNGQSQEQGLKGLQGNASGESQQGAKSANTEHRNGNRSAERRMRHGKQQSTAQREQKLKGLRGQVNQPNPAPNGSANGRAGTSTNARENTDQNGAAGSEASRGGGRVEGANITLNEEQRTDIRKTVIEGRHAPRVGHVDFSVRVGTVVPRRHIHMIRVPETLVRIEPRWRGYDYFIYSDEIVIVDPHDLKIVAIIPV